MDRFYDNFNLWLPSPLQKINFSNNKGISVFVKRDDLIHHDISGNKFRKLKYNIKEFYRQNKKQIIAFGGAFSNLLYTLSLMCRQMNIPAIFYIRGDGFDNNNPTLRYIKSNGVKMVFMSRTAFRNIRNSEFLEKLQLQYPDAYIIPEGGSNSFAVPGSAEILDEILEQMNEVPDYIVMDLGTGGTFAGVLSKIPENIKLIGISAIKGVDWYNTLKKIYDGEDKLLKKQNWDIIEDYHFGGFARFDDALIDFINNYKSKYGILLEPVYSGKMVFGIHELINKDYFEKGSKLVWIHGGGLQGIYGFNYLHGERIWL
ncbi:MAG TPA: pyridoxal-phosphate dependent enzyme [Bacteroidetes bacterium]|nr:pyridoxal-phosphate dependent enzyme [Bacteroidota bacterium]